MTTPPDPVRRRVLVWIAAVVAVLGLLVWALTKPSRAPFDEKVAELRAAGFAVTVDELYATALPEAENAAPEIEAAWNELVAARGRPDSWGVTGPWDYSVEHPWTATAGEVRLAALAKVLDEIGPFFDRLEVASRRPALRFPPRRDPDGTPSSRGWLLLQDVHRVLDAAISAHRDPRRRFAVSQTALRIAAICGEGSLIEEAVRGFYGIAGLRGVRDLVEGGRIPAAEARAACDPLLRERMTRRIPAAARSEVPHVVELVDAYLDGRLTFQLLGAPPAAWERTRIVQTWRRLRDGGPAEPTSAELAEGLDRLRRIAELPAAEPAVLLARIDEIDPEPSSPLWGGIWQSIARRIAQRDSARALGRVALAAAEFREREGRWPETVGELSPMFPDGVPVDPCDGKPFEMTTVDGRVRLTARGYVRVEDRDDDPREQGLVWEFGER